MTDASEWTTRLDPEITLRYGVEEMHSLWLAPRKSPAERNVVTLLIPECETQFVFAENKGVVLVNRPQVNKNLKHWLRFACSEARDRGALLHIACDTAEQAQRAAKLASRLLPNHERAALERIYEGDTRRRADLH